MGKRGPAPAPTALKIVRGDKPSRVNRSEPQPGESSIVCPRWLSTPAKAVWRRLAPDLIKRGILTPWDLDLFAEFCALVVLNRDAVVDVNQHGTVITVVQRELSDGTLIFGTTRNPNWQVARESAALLVTIGGRFGLNPSDRSQLKVEPNGQPDAKARLLS